MRVDTIKSNFRGINYFFVRNKFASAKWSDWENLKMLFRGCYRLQPKKDHTEAIQAPLIRKMKKAMVNHNWTNVSFICMVILAYCFALRPQDYTVTKTSPTLTWDNLKFNHDEKMLTITIPESKMNQRGPPEVVSFICPCTKNKPRICAYCTMKAYKSASRKRCNEEFVFSKQDKNGYRAFNYNRFLDMFKEYMTRILGKGYDTSIFRPHSLRYGRATDLALAGVPNHVIRRITRHAAKSKTLFRYINMKPRTIANEIVKRTKELKEG